MPPRPLTKRIVHLTDRERFLVYWLLRAYESGHREGWEEGPSVRETMDGLHAVLCNIDLDPNLSDQAKRILDNPPKRLCVFPGSR